MKPNPIAGQHLYQVVVMVKGRPVPVGPRVQRAMADEWAATIRRNIASGKERDWSDPQVVSCDVTTLH